jgi:predicted transcriptional regulator
MLKLSKGRSYCVPAVMHTLDILECLFDSRSPLKLAQVVARTNIAHSTAYRILKTLEERGYIVQSLNGGYCYFRASTDLNKSVQCEMRCSCTSYQETPEALLKHTIEILLGLVEGSKRNHPIPLPLEHKTVRGKGEANSQ